MANITITIMKNMSIITTMTMNADVDMTTITKNMSMITTTTMNTITIMKTTTMSTIMNMTRTAPADAMTTIIITIMQMKCLQAGAKRRLTNSRRKRSRMY